MWFTYIFNAVHEGEGIFESIQQLASLIWPLLHTHNVPQPMWLKQSKFATKFSDKVIKSRFLQCIQSMIFENVMLRGATYVLIYDHFFLFSLP